MMATVKVTDKTFREEVLGADTPVPVGFLAEWWPLPDDRPGARGAGRGIRSKIKIAKVNVDENPSLPAQFGVRGIPALMMFNKGELVSNRTGAAPKASLKGWIEETV